MDDQGVASKSPRWYQLPADPPFHLAVTFSCEIDASSSSTIAIFPWSNDSLEILWDGQLNTKEFLPSWKDMIHEWSGACAVGYVGKVIIYGLRPGLRPISVKFPPNNPAIPSKPHSSIVWAIRQETPFEPLLVFSDASLIYVFNVKRREVISYLRGHGGPITSIAVHPIHPSFFCTTSRDFSVRIYDLWLKPQQEPKNLHWPPATEPSLAGAAHGLHMTESEGIGIGRCVAVLAGGRSGGHLAAVLGAAFHPTLPLLATCGVDRAVKIWKLPPLHAETLAREDKPLFSSTQIHKARVLSVSWLSQDILLTHSAPALMRHKPDVPDHVYEEEGTLVLWRWLGLDRFFPPNMPYQKILRGCATDYQQSASFKLICVYSLPMATNNLHVYKSQAHDPIVLFPHTNKIRMLNVTHLTPRFASGHPPFPLDEDEMVESMKKARLDDDENDNEDENEEDETFTIPKHPKAPPIPEEWVITVNTSTRSGPVRDSERVLACAMGVGGGLIVAAGSEGSVWLWERKSSTFSLAS